MARATFAWMKVHGDYSKNGFGDAFDRKPATQAIDFVLS